MNEQELRTLVREAIARHTTGHPPLTAGATGATTYRGSQSLTPSHHASHAMFILPTGLDADGPCLIEPAVTCNHCGYCKSLGH